MLKQTTTVATPIWARAAVWTVLPAVGAALLLGVDRAADVVAGLSWAPMRGPAELIQNVPEPQATIGALALGAIAGLILAGLVDAESLTVRLSGFEVVLHRPGGTRTVPRSEVSVAFLEKDKLVLLGRTGRELAREPFTFAPKRVAAVFRSQGIAWSRNDPYADAYRRWIPGSPDVPADANAVFAARREALKSGDEQDITELREELGRLGFVVRDEKKRQYWRRVS